MNCLHIFKKLYSNFRFFEKFKMFLKINCKELISAEMLLDVDPYDCKDDKEEPEQKNF